MDDDDLVLTRHKITAVDFCRLVEFGVLREDERIELIKASESLPLVAAPDIVVTLADMF